MTIDWLIYVTVFKNMSTGSLCTMSWAGLVAADLPREGKVIRVAVVIGTVASGAQHAVDGQGYQACTGNIFLRT